MLFCFWTVTFLVPDAQVSSSTLAALSPHALPRVPECPQRECGGPMTCSVTVTVISKALCLLTHAELYSKASEDNQILEENISNKADRIKRRTQGLLGLTVLIGKETLCPRAAEAMPN